MGGVLILSSFVAASAVGGGYQAKILAGLEIDTVLVPTVLFGRHPGLGPPGGGATPNALFEGMLEGVAATGAFSNLEAVITGYFADPAQIAAVAGALDTIKAARPETPILVDPIMGDDGKGLYVKPEVARAVTDLLVPRADLLAPNAWELGRLTGHVVSGPAEALAAARDLGRPVLVSSVPVGRRIGVIWTDGAEAWIAHHPRAPSAPNGTGDLLTALFAAALTAGAEGPDALETAVGDVAARILGDDMDVVLESLT